MNELYDKLNEIALRDAEITEIELHKPMNTKEQWEEDFDKQYPSQKGVSGGMYIVMHSTDSMKDFIRETREQAKKEERERIKKAIKFVTITPFDDNNRKLADALELFYQRDINPEMLKLL